MSEFEKELTSFRLARTHHGDSLQALCARELGDANRWPELVWLNDLTPPYLTDDPALASDRVLLSGSFIRVPSAAKAVVEEAEYAQIFARDCGLYGKRLAANEAGDFALTSGVDNLTQQLRHAINTPRGQQTRHPDYGCLVWTLFGTVNGPTATRLGAEYVKSTLGADYRVSRVISAVAESNGDAVNITAQAEAIDGGIIDLINENPDALIERPSEDDQMIMHFDLLHEFVHFTLPTNING